MMATLVDGPFFLSRALGLDPATVGVVLVVGPLIGALTGVAAGRIADRFGAPRLTIEGLVVIRGVSDNDRARHRDQEPCARHTRSRLRRRVLSLLRSDRDCPGLGLAIASWRLGISGCS
jgi:MFS family permease